jgi:antirestriction protein ArdC
MTALTATSERLAAAREEDGPSGKRDRLLEELTAGVAELTTSDRWQRFLDVQSRFHHYSFLNTLAIELQRPGATEVAGFRTWRGLGRRVRKGEKGIAILAPVVRRTRVEDDNGETHVLVGAPTAFRVVHVFDIAQTDGEELPTIVERLEGEDTGGAYVRLVEVARSLGYTVEEDYLPGERNGQCSFAERRITVEVSNAEAQQVKTLAHEIAHAMLHEGFTDRALAELEAESVAFVVCRALGIESASYSFGYVAHWAGGGTEAVAAIKAAGARIQNTADAIIEKSNAAIERVAA